MSTLAAIARAQGRRMWRLPLLQALRKERRRWQSERRNNVEVMISSLADYCGRTDNKELEFFVTFGACAIAPSPSSVPWRASNRLGERRSHRHRLLWRWGSKSRKHATVCPFVERYQRIALQNTREARPFFATVTRRFSDRFSRPLHDGFTTVTRLFHDR